MIDNTIIQYVRDRQNFAVHQLENCFDNKNYRLYWSGYIEALRHVEDEYNKQVDEYTQRLCREQAKKLREEKEHETNS